MSKSYNSLFDRFTATSHILFNIDANNDGRHFGPNMFDLLTWRLSTINSRSGKIYVHDELLQFFQTRNIIVFNQYTNTLPECISGIVKHYI